MQFLLWGQPMIFPASSINGFGRELRPKKGELPLGRRNDAHEITEVLFRCL